MRAVLLVPLVVVAAAAGPAPVAAASGPPTGAQCGFAAMTDPTGTWIGEMAGGPVAAPGAASVQLTCSIHVGNTTHSGGAVVSESSVVGPGVTALEPRPVSYYAEDWEVVVMCTQVTVDATTWYYGDGVWTTDPGTSCVSPLWPPVEPFPDLPPPVDVVVGGVLCLLGPSLRSCDTVDPLLDYVFVDTVDPVLCDVLDDLGPGEPGVVEVRDDGDVYVGGEWFWDCPPYGS